MFKIIGATVVILSAGLFGMKKYNEIFERKKVLQEIYDGCMQVSNSLRCMCLPLHESFLYGGSFFESAAEKIGGGMLPCEAVKDTAYSLHALTGEDLRIIERFAEGLLARDCTGQLSNIELFSESIKTEIKNAANELDSRGKLYVKGSILTAAAVVLLLI